MSQDNENALRFPSNVKDRPFIRFLIRKREAETGRMDLGGGSRSINLFVPMDLQIADSANFDTINLGAISAFKSAVTSKENTDTNSRESIAIAAAVINQATAGTFDGANKVGLVSKNVASNNMTTATFNDMGIRNFNFNFQMMPSSQKESETITQIENTFRKFMYPKKIGATGFALEYPPLFRITFHDPNGEINKYFPTIKDCYLTSLNTNYNQQGGNMFFKDGAPTDTSISLSFQEQRQLTREDLYHDIDDIKSATPKRLDKDGNNAYDTLFIG